MIDTMKRRAGTSAVAKRYSAYLIPLFVAAAPLHAQRAGSPPFQPLLHGPGYGVAVQLTRADLLPATGRTTMFGAAIDALVGRVFLTAGGALVEPSDASSGWSVDAAIAPQLCAPLRPASITGGFHLCDLLPEQFGLRLRGAAGFAAVPLANDDAHITEAALGTTVNVRAPAPFGTIELWTEPRLQLRSANAAASGATESTSRAGLGWSLGLAITATSGLGGSIVLDGLWIERPPDERFRAKSAGIGFALHYLR